MSVCKSSITRARQIMDKTSAKVVAGNSQANYSQESFDTTPQEQAKPGISLQVNKANSLFAASDSTGAKATGQAAINATNPSYVVNKGSLTPQQSFCNAVIANNGRDMAALLMAHKGQIDINQIDKATGKSLLRTALEAKNEEAAKVLVMHGAPVNARDDQERTPVMLAAAAGLKSMVNTLISRGATVDDVDKSGATALHHAVQGGNPEIARELIRTKADVGATDKWGCAPLHYAATAGDAETVQVLIDAGAKADPKDKTRTTPLWNACKAGNVAVVKILLDKGAKAERYCGALKDSTPMLAACNAGNDLQALAIVKLLMDKKASANVADKKNGNVPLIAAARNGLFSTTAYLLNEGGASPQAVNKADETALYAAQGKVVKLLNDHGIKNGLRQKI